MTRTETKRQILGDVTNKVEYIYMKSWKWPQLGDKIQTMSSLNTSICNKECMITQEGSLLSYAGKY
jgi:hypothetical protein